MKPPVALDVFEFARTGQVLAGEAPLAAFPRLAETAGDLGLPVRWRAVGAMETIHGARTAPILKIEADTSVGLECQRCLEPLQLPISVRVRLELVEDASLAENADLEDEEVDVVLGSKKFDLLWQIEEEMLLAVPYAPRHPNCSTRVAAETVGGTGKEPSPFAVLAQLKKKNRN